ncbi:hypothetical protein [Gemmiger sp.]|uniref:hypothetical protein n=1 Tax=Gemmiger sp. TaxID=2049027 RepID=UPI003AB14D1C
MVKAVIFDMDGLMFDTERLWDTLWEPACKELGLPLREPPAPADLVLDRYSAAKVYLDGLCVEDEE